MTKPKSDQGIVERDAKRGYTEDDLADVLDNPEWTDQELADAKPFVEVFPDLAASIRSARGKPKPRATELVSLRLDRDVIARFKADGPGWQVRMGKILRKAVGL